MTHIEVVREALAWHEYGSQDDRRRKALAALDSLEAELAQVRAERDHLLRHVSPDMESCSCGATRKSIAAELKQVREERDEARATLQEHVGWLAALASEEGDA